MQSFVNVHPKVLREKIRNGTYTGRTSGCCRGYVQANLVILPERYADDFTKFCQRNPKPCPVLEVLDKGDPRPKFLAADASIATDLSSYRIFKKGELVEERGDISDLWQDDFIGYLTGCSYSFEDALMKNNIEIRNITDNHVVAHYITNIPCAPGGIFTGPVVVTMRPIPEDRIDDAYRITGQFPHVHGMPIYHGDPSRIGIDDLNKPAFGYPPTRVLPGEVPVFWACGVTPQMAIAEAKPDIVITHTPAHMFVCDILDVDIEEKLCEQGQQ